MDHDAFMQAICNNPDDDAPRLVYADWLEEQGDPRGEFIRLSCERAKLPRMDPRRQALTKRIDALKDAYDLEWREELPHLPGVAWGVYHRGFIHLAQITGSETFARHAADMFAAAPIQTLVMQELDVNGLRAMLAAALMAKVRRLELDGNNLGDEGALLLARCPHLVQLTHLFLSSSQIGFPGAQALAESRCLVNLRVLMLHGNPIGDAGGRELEKLHRLPKLEELMLKDCNLHMEAIDRLRRQFGAILIA